MVALTNQERKNRTGAGATWMNLCVDVVLLSVFWCMLPGVLWADFYAKRCLACEELSRVVSRRLEETATVGRKIMVGGRIGPDGESVSKGVIDYADSEQRLTDILEKVCDPLKKKKECYTILDDFEEPINEWFLAKRTEPFLTAVCYAKLKNCNERNLQAFFQDELRQQVEERVKKIQSDVPKKDAAGVEVKGEEGEKSEKSEEIEKSEKIKESEKIEKREKWNAGKIDLGYMLKDVIVRAYSRSKAMLESVQLEGFVLRHLQVLRNPEKYGRNWIYLIVPSLLGVLLCGLLLNAVLGGPRAGRRGPVKRRGREAKVKTN